jgi:hypothetical protein
MMKTARIFLLLVLLIVTSSIVYSITTVEQRHNIVLNTQDNSASKKGFVITPLEDITLTSVRKNESSDCSMVYVWDSSRQEIARANYSGNIATFSLAMRQGSEYYILTDKEGAGYIDRINAGTFPKSSTKISWVTGYFDGVGNINEAHVIESISVSFGALWRPINGTINFTSDGGQICGYNGTHSILCGPTEDGTPSFKFRTNGSASCKVWTQPYNWTTLDNMGVPDCGTTGGISHICTMSEALPNGTNTLYFSCKSGSEEINDYSLYPENKLNISIRAPLSTTQYANDAIEFGITKSIIWPGAIIYTSQPVYIRTKNNSQAYGVFDKVAVYGSQRWAFNYRLGNEDTVNSNGQFYNISPAFYFWEGANLSFYQASSSVSHLINTTRS